MTQPKRYLIPHKRRRYVIAVTAGGCFFMALLQWDAGRSQYGYLFAILGSVLAFVSGLKSRLN